MEFIKPGINIDFIGKRRLFLVISTTLLLVSLLSLAVRGINFGTDFAGGSDIQVSFREDVPVADVREAVYAMGFPDAEIQNFGEGTDRFDFLIRLREQVTLINPEQAAILEATINNQREDLGALLRFDYAEEAGDRVYMVFDRPVEAGALEELFSEAGFAQTRIVDAGLQTEHRYTAHLQEVQGKIAAGLSDHFGEVFGSVERAEIVGPAAGRQLRNDGILAMAIALIAILLYIAIRFDFRYAPGAVAALLHDLIITIGVFSLLQRQFSLTSVAALLTIIGYSLNDTIVVFDRIRENLQIAKDKPLAQVMNRSLNETLSRTLLTSVTTLLVVLSIFILGGGLIRDFALALLVGVMVGTYSSVAVASPLTLWFDKTMPDIYEKLFGRKMGKQGRAAAGIPGSAGGGSSSSGRSTI